MTATIATAKIAQVALDRMKASGINKGGRAMFGSFTEAKRVTRLFMNLVRSDIADLEKMGALDAETRQRMGIVIAHPQTFRSWLELHAWLGTVESHLENLIEQGNGRRLKMTKPEAWTYVVIKGSKRTVRRFSQDAKGGDMVQHKDKGEWVESHWMVKQLRSLVEAGEAWETDEFGTAIGAEPTTTNEEKTVSTLNPNWVRIKLAELIGATPTLIQKQCQELEKIREWTTSDSGEDYALFDAKQAVVEAVKWIDGQIEIARIQAQMVGNHAVADKALKLASSPLLRMATDGDIYGGSRFYTPEGKSVWLETYNGAAWGGRMDGVVNWYSRAELLELMVEDKG